MKVLSIGFNKQYVIFDRMQHNFYCIKNVGFQVPKEEHFREALLFCFNHKKSVAESHRLLVEVYGRQALSESFAEISLEDSKITILT